MPARADFVVSLSLFHSGQKRLSFPALATWLLLTLLGGLLLGLTGCGASNAPKVVPGAAPGSRIRKGNIFTPVPLPLSPDSVGEINDVKAVTQSRKKAGHPGNSSESGALDSPPNSPPGPIMNSWFYLVNGSWFSNGSGPSIPVLTVNGAAPAGAPNPNGGTGVGVAPLGSYPATNQLWKAVPWAGNFFLRSAESFRNNNTTGIPSPLTGFGQVAAPLDLGYNFRVNDSAQGYTAAQTAIFLNQSGSVNGDTSQFQQWTYNTTYAVLGNIGQMGLLDNMSSGIAIDEGCLQTLQQSHNAGWLL